MTNKTQRTGGGPAPKKPTKPTKMASAKPGKTVGTTYKA
jgi:hypothetical protein